MKKNLFAVFTLLGLLSSCDLNTWYNNLLHATPSPSPAIDGPQQSPSASPSPADSPSPSPADSPSPSPSAAPLPVSTVNRSLIGINFNFAPTSDWSEDRLFADAMKQARKWYKAGDATIPAAVDANFWPTEDAGLVVMALGRAEGTYHCSFTGKATVSPGIYGAHGTIQNVAWDSAANKTTFQIVVTDAGDGAMSLKFTGTAGGITNLKIMRPKYRGSSESYAEGTLFTDQSLALYSKFGVIRFMDYLSTNSNQLTSWSARPLPDDSSFSNRSASGGCLEYAVDLCNQVNADMWVCVPLKADDDYVTQMATLIKGRLNSNLNVYLEYSNEVWNTGGGFTQGNENHELAKTDVANGKAPLLSAGGCTNDWYWAWRRIGLRGAEISDLFRAVWTDANMPAPGKASPRVRPILASQQGYIDGPTAQMLMFLDQNLPHPVNYYFYGGGGSGYYNPTSAADVTIDSIWTSDTMDPAYWLQKHAKQEAAIVRAFGLKRICYEGGPSFDKGAANDAVRQLAVSDYRMTGNIVNHITQAWYAADSDLFVFYAAAGDYQWGFTQDIFNLNTPKLRAIYQLTATPKCAPSVGAQTPATVKGKDYDLQLVYGSYPYVSGDSVVLKNYDYAVYQFRTNEEGTHQLKLNLGGTTTGDVLVYCDGLPRATIPAGTLGTIAPIELGNLGPGVHPIMIKTAATWVSNNTVAMD
jgi:hypothetical protein